MENIGASKIIERYKALSTPAISDALDRLGIKGGCEGIKPLFYGIRAVGFAVTLATHGDKRGLKPAVEMINYKYGLKLREEDIYKIGNKILDIEKEFNEKCGISKFANDVPDFMRKEKLDTHGSAYDVDKEELAEF